MAMSTRVSKEDVLRPMRRTSTEYYYVLAIAAVAIGIFAVATPSSSSTA
jgi:hypothetical protein